MAIAGFDALKQLFEQIDNRLVNLDRDMNEGFRQMSSKLDTKADLATVAALEGRIRDLELTAAARIPQLDATVDRVLKHSDRIEALEKKEAVASFRLDSPKKKVLAGGAGAVVLAGLAKGVFDFIQNVVLR